MAMALAVAVGRKMVMKMPIATKKSPAMAVVMAMAV
jgi:hypothetical protein